MPNKDYKTLVLRNVQGLYLAIDPVLLKICIEWNISETNTGLRIHLQ